ncbi:MAG: ABC transporter permease [Eubacteriales bacterium]
MTRPTPKLKVPLVRIARRDPLPGWRAWLVRFSAIFAAMLVCALIIYGLTKMNPFDMYATMFEGAFKTPTRAKITVLDAMPLLLISLALAPVFKMRYWNIGAEGQVLVGATVTAACMIYFPHLSPVLLFLLMIVGSSVAGGLWSLLPATFKALWNTNETLFTLMMNYVAMQLVSYLVTKWERPPGSNAVGIINARTKEGWLPRLFEQNAGWSLIIVLCLMVCMYVYLKHTKHGYEIAVVGESLNTARYAGINVKKVIIRTSVLSGLICGFAGFLLVSGSSHTISTNTAGGQGFTAIIVAWMSHFNAFVMLLVSFFIIFLKKGGAEIASAYNLTMQAYEIITGIFLFFIIGSEFFLNYKLIFRSRRSQKEAV